MAVIGQGTRESRRVRVWTAWLVLGRRILRSRLGWFGVTVTLGLIIVALGAGLIAPRDPNVQSYRTILQAPSATHWMGTDHYGRDLTSRVIYGSRVSVVVGVLSVGLSVVAGSILGLAAGYGSSWADEIIMRLMDALYAFPGLLLALAITAVLGPGLRNVIIAIGLVYIPVFARLVRGQTLSVRERDYVTAARAIGTPALTIVRRHIWPNVTAPVIVQASLSVSFAIIAEASLSFLGVGVQPPTPSWGAMVRTGYSYVEMAPWMSLFPGAAIFVTVLGLNILGDALRSALDPRLNTSQR